MSTRWPEAAARWEPNLEIIDYHLPATRPFWRALLMGPDAPIVRRFSDQALNDSIDAVMASLPADKRGAKINVGFKDGDVLGVLVVRLNKEWSIQGGIQREKGGALTWQAGAEWSF